MKKILCVLFAAMMICTAATAVETAKSDRDETKWTSISYVNVPIYKILESKDGYTIIYGKNRMGTGSTIIPKKWAKGNADTPRKLKFRTVTGNLMPFMTVIKKDGTFLRVILNVPNSKGDNIWGVADNSNASGTDKDTLEDLEM